MAELSVGDVLGRLLGMLFMALELVAAWRGWRVGGARALTVYLLFAACLMLAGIPFLLRP